MKIVIIGAGPAGLTAALELLKANQNHEVCILEAEESIGGISRTVNYHGLRMDIGGHRFFSKDQRVVSWWNEILPFDADPTENDQTMLLRKRVSRIFYEKKLYDYPIKMSGQTIHNFGIKTTVSAGFSYFYSMLFKLPEDSLENFYINRFGRKLYTMFFESYTEKVWGRHPREISAEWGAQRVKGLSVLALLKDMLQKAVPWISSKQTETSLIEEFRYPKYGPGQLWETVAQQIIKRGGIIKLNSRVSAVCTENHTIKTITYQRNNQEIIEQADCVLSSMPLCDLIAGMNAVPQEVQRVACGLPYRDFVTIGLLVSRLALSDQKEGEKLVPDCWIYVQEHQVKLGRIQIFNNWSPYLNPDAKHTVWLGLEYFCQEHDAFWNTTEAELIAYAQKELIRIGVLATDEPILDAHVEKVKKAYPAYFDSYQEIDRIKNYLNGFDNLYCIGRNGQHRYNNMDHSMATSFAAVEAILSKNPDKTAIWNVNTEQSYHEEKEHAV